MPTSVASSKGIYQVFDQKMMGLIGLLLLIITMAMDPHDDEWV